MTKLETAADNLNRVVKLALDTGEAATIEDAERIFEGYRVQMLLGPDVAANPVLQAAALTAVNCASRTLLGGVRVVGAAGELAVPLPGPRHLLDALAALGGQPAREIDPQCPTIIFGDAALTGLDTRAVRATYDHWAGGVTGLGSRLAERGTFTTAGVLAGALAVSEVFQLLRPGTPIAGRRSIGLNLWRPDLHWRSSEAGPALERLPASAWLVGMGNLGQAYLWTLGLLPYGEGGPALVLQDLDFLARSNLSTSLLTQPALLGLRKTRAMAGWAEARGFRTTIVERSFTSNFHVEGREPPIALMGVDNALARQSLEDVGFDRVIEAGLGKGPKDFLGIGVHTFPASRKARDIWADTAPADAEIAQPAYRALLEQTGDRCGIVRLAGRSIGAPFVGAVAASLVIAELIRLSLGAHRYEMVDCHLRDLESRSVVAGPTWYHVTPAPSQYGHNLLPNLDLKRAIRSAHVL
jgi:hypothetical protein